jgi:hypothetical protein
MGRWRGFLDSLATTGGHIFVLLYLINLGVIIVFVGDVHNWMKVAEMGSGMFGFAFGALAMMYKPSGTNSEQLARAGVPYQPPQPPPDALHPPVVVAGEPLPPSEKVKE